MPITKTIYIAIYKYTNTHTYKQLNNIIYKRINIHKHKYLKIFMQICKNI